MKGNHFKYLVVRFLKGQYLDVEEYGADEITLNLKDINYTVNDESWETALLRILKEAGFDATFEYGDGDWVTVEKKK